MSQLPRLPWTLFSMLLPVAYMVGMHLTWMKDTSARYRMAMKHLGFWGGMTGTWWVTHRWASKTHTRVGGLFLYLLAASFPVIGYEGARRLAGKVFPKSPPPLLRPSSPPFRINPSVSTMAKQPRPLISRSSVPYTTILNRPSFP